MKKESAVVGRKYLILSIITSLFALWGIIIERSHNFLYI
jgi:hypothetical protein